MQKDLKGSNFDLAFQPLGDLNLEASLNPFKPIKYVYFEEGFVKTLARLADIFLQDGSKTLDCHFTFVLPKTQLNHA